MMVYSQWWRGWRSGGTTERLTILELANSGTIDFRLAALLWILMEHRASILVAAGPSFAGKTTLLHAILDLLPPDIKQVPLCGYDEDFEVLFRSEPDKTYLVIEELSNHGYEYLWGQQAARTFELLPFGYALGGTIHARTAEEVVYILQRALGLPLTLIARIGVIITLRVSYNRSYNYEPTRRVDTVSLIVPAGEGLSIQALAMRQSPDREFVYTPDTILHDVLSKKFNMKYNSVASEIKHRERFLGRLRNKGLSSREGLKKEVGEYYRTHRD